MGARTPVSRRLAVGLTVLTLVVWGCGGDDQDGEGQEAATTAELVAQGQVVYKRTCAACHGADLRGTRTGPPFLHPTYAPNHHADAAFYAAVESGVRPHHWSFGPMPPQPGVGRDEVEAIVAYVRSEQAKAGITRDPTHP